MKLFFSYLRTRRTVLAAFFVFAFILSVSFALYRLPIEAVVYPCVLCLFAGCGFLVRDFFTFRKKHETLEKIKKLTIDVIDKLPAPDTLAEKDCHDIIESIKAQSAERETLLNARYRDMTEYYGAWAHQIKTPIASMKLTLQSEDSPASRRSSAELMRIERYVEMVLAFLRLDSTSTDYVFRSYSLDSLVRQSVKKFAPDFIDKKLKLEYEPPAGNIVTDEKWFAFVIEQLLSNAVKYTNEGGVKIYADDSGTLYIADTGIGIAPQDLPRIFEKGYTGFNGRLDKSASGIGLYLCKRICDNLGISVSVQSQPGKGTVIALRSEQTSPNGRDIHF